jgi:hypothetical protein
MSYELGSVVMPSWSKTLVGVRGVEDREKEGSSPCAQALILVAWRGSARAANKMLPREDLTVAPPGAPQPALPPACSLTQRSSRRSTAGVVEEASESSQWGCSVTADPEGRHHPDLLGEEAAEGTAWGR